MLLHLDCESFGIAYAKFFALQFKYFLKDPVKYDVKYQVLLQTLLNIIWFCTIKESDIQICSIYIPGQRAAVSRAWSFGNSTSDESLIFWTHGAWARDEITERYIEWQSHKSPNAVLCQSCKTATTKVCLLYCVPKFCWLIEKQFTGKLLL